MTESEPKPPNRATRRRWRRAYTAVAVVIVVSMAAGATVYVTRRTIARELLVGWLDARGVPADVEFRDFEYGGFTARVRAGPANDPDVSVERVEVRYGFTGPWAGKPLVGFVLSREAAGEGEILTIAVSEKVGRLGLGWRLMQAALNETRLRGAEAMFLEVDSANSPAIALYRKLGFDKVGERPAYYTAQDGTRSTALVMRCNLG